MLSSASDSSLCFVVYLLRFKAAPWSYSWNWLFLACCPPSMLFLPELRPSFTQGCFANHVFVAEMLDSMYFRALYMRAANAYSLPSNSFHMTLSWTFSAFSDLLLFVCLLFFFFGGGGKGVVCGVFLLLLARRDSGTKNSSPLCNFTQYFVLLRRYSELYYIVHCSLEVAGGQSE